LLKFIDQLPQKQKGAHDSDISNLAFECYSQARLITTEDLAKVDPELDVRANLDRICEELSAKVSKLSVALTATYFSHSTYQSQGNKDGFKFEV
jgi:hypothetical protein